MPRKQLGSKIRTLVQFCGYVCKKCVSLSVSFPVRLSALSASNSEGFCAGGVGVIKDLIKNPKSESYSVFSAWENISFLFDSTSPISIFQPAMLAWT